MLTSGIIYGIYNPAIACYYFPDAVCQGATYMHELCLAAGAGISASLTRLWKYATQFSPEADQEPVAPIKEKCAILLKDPNFTSAAAQAHRKTLFPGMSPHARLWDCGNSGGPVVTCSLNEYEAITCP